MSSAAYVRGTGDEKLRALFHYQKMRVILDAVLRSTAGTKNEATIAVPDLPKLVNNAKCAVDVPDRELAEMTASSGTDLARLELLRMLARLGQLQIRPLSEDPLSTAGRAIALLVVVPELHPEKVLLRVKNAKAVLEHPPPTCWDWGPTVC